MLRRVLLVCGVLSSLLYVGIDLLAAFRHGEYHSFTSVVISELGARGAPTKPLVDPLFILYDLLAIAFGIGVWLTPGRGRPWRLTGAMLIAYGLVGLPSPWLYPMNLRGVGGDLPHIVMTGVIVLFILGAVSFGAFALGRRFRYYSFATLLGFVVLGALTTLQAPGMASGAPTPWIGLTERANIGLFLVWAATLAIGLLRRDPIPAAWPSRQRRPAPRDLRTGGRGLSIE